nr:histone H1 [Sinomicrobium weinanense]
MQKFTVQMKDLLGTIQSEIETFNAEAQLQVEKGNKAAGTRARKSALEISKLMKEFRKVSLEESKK